MQRSDLSLLTALGALAVFVGSQSFAADRRAAHRTESVSSGAVAAARDVRPRARDAADAAATAELPAEVRAMSREDVRRALETAGAGTYIDEVLLDRDSALTRWPDRVERPLTVWISRATHLEGWKDKFINEVATAFNTWEQVGIPVRFTAAPDSASADVHVLWTSRFKEPISGKTVWSRDDRWWIVDADITLALHHRDGDPLDAAQVRAIALHEIGHLLGLDHTGDQTNVMAPRVRVRDLSSADRATVRRVSVPAWFTILRGSPWHVPCPRPGVMPDETIYDVAIVGGGPAGLSAAIWLGRYLHSVVLIDSGDPRNWETHGINGYLGLPGVRPAELRGAGRDEAKRYGVTLIDGYVVRARAEGEERFVVEYDPLPETKAEQNRPGPGRPRDPQDNEPRPCTTPLVARRLLLAIGLKDVWPRIEGIGQVYGDRAHVCPDCDGYDARGRKTVVIGKGRKAVGMALNLTTWTSDITLCTNGDDPELDDYLAGKLEALDIPVIRGRIERVNLREGSLRSLHFDDGRTIGCEKIFFAIGQYPADDLGAQLGCERDDDGHLVVDRHQHTSVYNVYAAGDIIPGPQLGVVAAAEGAIAALSIHKSLVPDERKLAKPEPAAAR